MIGELDRMPQFARKRLSQCIKDTSHCTGLTLVLAISYSSRWEITAAVKAIAAKVAAGQLAVDDINPDTVSQNLTTRDMPDPDLIIRTGGDFRISNFLLWQAAYAEIYVTPTYWPDFSPTDLRNAIISFQNRERRFGMTSEQINEEK